MRSPTPRAGWGRASSAFAAATLVLDRQPEADRRALSFDALDRELSVRLTGEAVDRRQPEAGALAERLRREERFDRARRHGRRHADAAVGHREFEIEAGRRIDERVARGELDLPRRDRQRAAVGHRVACVDDRFSSALSIWFASAMADGSPSPSCVSHHDAFVDAARHELLHRLDELVQVDRIASRASAAARTPAGDASAPRRAGPTTTRRP